MQAASQDLVALTGVERRGSAAVVPSGARVAAETEVEVVAATVAQEEVDLA